MIDVSKYSTKKELFDYLVSNKSELYSLKKATIKHCDTINFESGKETLKAFNYQSDDNISEGSIKRVIVANTYNWMDSHDDVHIEGIFTKSLQESKAKVMHLHDHLFQLTAKVGNVIDIFEQKMAWSDVGTNKGGETTAVLLYSDIKKKYNELIFDQYLSKQITQHSVGMQYVKIAMAINDPEYKEEYATWNLYSSKIANISKAIDKGYYFAVTEAKLIEISAVISGSNELTPTLEPIKSTPLEPLDTLKKRNEYILNNLKFK